MRRIHLALPLLLLTVACNRTVNTLPRLARPASPVEQILLQIPEGLEIRSVDYDAAMYSEATDANLSFALVGGRAFVKVMAVDRRTGELVLLLYENITQRAAPIQVIRFVATPTDPTSK